MQRTGDAAAAVRAFCLAFGLCSLGACASSRPDIIQAGPWFPKKNWKNVEVFSSRDEIRLPWGGIAVIHGKKFSAGVPRELQKQILAARKIAATAGADGVIIGVEGAEGGPAAGYGREELYVSALAIKYVTHTSTNTGK